MLLYRSAKPIVHMGRCTVAGHSALSQLLSVSNSRFALGSGGSLSSALNSVQLADLLGETQGLAPPPSAFALSATAQTAPRVVTSSAPVKTILPLADRLGSLGPRAVPCSASNVQRGGLCPAWGGPAVLGSAHAELHAHSAGRMFTMPQGVDPTTLPLVIHDSGEQPHGLGWSALPLSLPGAYAFIVWVAAPWLGLSAPTSLPS